MRGRLEHKIKLEGDLQSKINDMPEYMKRFYFSLNQKSHTTKKTYINNVIRFLTHIYGEKLPTIDQISQLDSYNIQVYMSEIGYYEVNGKIQELKESSQAAIYSSLSTFFTFLSNTYKTVNNPFLNKMIDRPVVPEKSIIFLTPEEIRMFEKQILSGAGNSLARAKQKKWRYRDVLLFRIPIVNGIRLTALSEINMEDIDFDNRKITVTEKGNITKKVDYDQKTAMYLSMWFNDRRMLLYDKPEEKALFISNRKTRMTTRSIENIIDKYSICIDGKNVTPHTLRRSFGTNTYQVTHDIKLTSELLGHKTTAPTRRYVAVFDEDKTATINKVAELYQ